MFGRRRAPSAGSSLLMFHTDHPIPRISSCLVLYRVPRSGSFTLAKRSGEKDYTWWYRTPSFLMTMQGVTPLLLLSRTSCAAGNGRFWNIHRTHPIVGQVAPAARRWAGRPRFDPGCRRGGDFSSLLRVQTGSGVYSASYKMSTGGFPGGKGDRA